MKALEILSVPPSERWTPATWTNDDGEWRAVGPGRANRKYPRLEGESEDDHLKRCFDAVMSENEAGCYGDTQAQADAAYACLAVNLAPYMAAVVRAAKAYRSARDAYIGASGFDGRGDILTSYDVLLAALDAFEAAAAKEMT